MARQQIYKQPEMDWGDDSLLYTRLQKFQRDCNEVFRGILNKESNTAKAYYLLSWLPDHVKDYLYSTLNGREEFKEPAQIFEELEKKYKMKVNELSSFTRLCNLTQGNKPLAEFLTEARKLVTECSYPNDGERLLRDIIVCKINSKSAYTKCVEKGRNLTLEQAMDIINNDEAVKRQVEFTRPELKNPEYAEFRNSTATEVNKIMDNTDSESASDSESVHRMGGFKQKSPKNRKREFNNSNNGCTSCGYYKRHPKEQCRAKDVECYKCHRTGHFSKCCLSKSPSKSRNSYNSSQNSRILQLERVVKQLASNLKTQSTDTEVVDCMAQDFTDISFPVNKLSVTQPVYQMKSHVNGEQMRPMWISQHQNSEITETVCEVDTGAGCNVMGIDQAKKLFQTE